MKAYINAERTIVGVLVYDFVGAGHLGYEFACRYPDLTKNGWILFYYGSEEELEGGANGKPIFEVGGCAKAIAEAIEGLCPAYGRPGP